MRKLLGVALLALTGCATAGTSIREEPFGAATYKLVEVQSYELPHLMVDGSLDGIEVVSGDLQLRPDNTFEMRINGQIQLSALKPLPFTRTYRGEYVSSPMGATLTWQYGGSTTGAFVGSSLRIYRDGVEYFFSWK